MDPVSGWQVVDVDPDSEYLVDFVSGYVRFALDLVPFPDGGDPELVGSFSENGFDLKDLAADALFECMRECAEFLVAVGDKLDVFHVKNGYLAFEAGGDFARARNSDDLGFLEQVFIPFEEAQYLQGVAGEWGETRFLLLEDKCGGAQIWS